MYTLLRLTDLIPRGIPPGKRLRDAPQQTAAKTCRLLSLCPGLARRKPSHALILSACRIGCGQHDGREMETSPVRATDQKRYVLILGKVPGVMQAVTKIGGHFRSEMDAPADPLLHTGLDGMR